jgi:uncharacterized protein YdeI (YjbR/CyaY-like superfamily)
MKKEIGPGGVSAVHAPTRKAWRDWLTAHHASEDRAWLILYKKNGGGGGLNYEGAVEEALCFGWIDSKPNKRDEASYYQFFSRRKPDGPWSAINKKRVEKLMAAGLMMPAGSAAIETARRNGAWTKIDCSEAMVMPPVLKKALAADKVARKNFEAFPPGVRKAIFQWIISAKTEATIQKRVTETVTLAAQNIRANQWRNRDQR